MKRAILSAVIFILLFASCSPSPSAFQTAIAGTMIANTPIPTQTAYPTLTPYPPYSTYTPYPTATIQPAIVMTYVVVQTPTPNASKWGCTPMTKMDYSNNTKAFVMLQAYVNLLPDVRQVSYTIPENLYNNRLSSIVYVNYVSDKDGTVYSKRYIVYLREFDWVNGVFSIDGQCWVDGPY